ncbi:hypothetical protein HC251_13500 [Iamia sp. SCSIO 61187]|uniref:hypothetical protein n=1 Tax=Iamia sp. SCSIO 61187 TaxID=2722752 RepID=UPI001C625DED|nr:hypothetical protein [Iamia sp. SCSIO 61187]QYG93339.1 hypothetical protein HC251_13500 [Iamia sp. SCSIO 61187]
MTSSSLRRLALGLAAPAVLALGLSACGSSDASRSDVQEQLEKGGLSEEQATCVTDSLFDELDQGQINDLYEADTPEEAGEAATEALTTATQECVSAE